MSATALVAAAEDLTGRGAARAVRAAHFAVPLADSVRESQSRVLIHVMGFPAPGAAGALRAVGRPQRVHGLLLA